VYAGFYLGTRSATWLGTHQKFNRSAYRALRQHFNHHLNRVEAAKEFSKFPTLKNIQHFEGEFGPDSIKSKTPGQNEPWHYLDPFNGSDTQLIELIENHIENLAIALRKRDEEKAAFEASWLAHAVVDGLTPAHHYPYEEELEQIRGEGKETRNSKKKKMFIKGSGMRDTLWRNWLVIGARGVLTTHLMFEMNITAALITHRIRGGSPSDVELEVAHKQGYAKFFRMYAQQIARLNMYGAFIDHGWSRTLHKKVRHHLAPAITRAVALAWLTAIEKSKEPA